MHLTCFICKFNRRVAKASVQNPLPRYLRLQPKVHHTQTRFLILQVPVGYGERGDTPQIKNLADPVSRFPDRGDSSISTSAVPNLSFSRLTKFRRHLTTYCYRCSQAYEAKKDNRFCFPTWGHLSKERVVTYCQNAGTVE